MKPWALHLLAAVAALAVFGLAGLAYATVSFMIDFAACTIVEERSIPSPISSR
ncbi:hypothetical protein ACQR1Y_34265 [Bradyrhizobium sp. HKCCYLRH3099]|uniref:hypothetical protein n=1 Tax=unclassified Bradyrhizobium TaxID=2631580 RepID=UPI003EB7716D